MSKSVDRRAPPRSVDGEEEGSAQECMAERDEKADGIPDLGQAGCWVGPLPEAEGATYTHRDLAAFVLGIDPTPEHETPVFTDGLDEIPAMVALANLLQTTGAPTPLVVQ